MIPESEMVREVHGAFPWVETTIGAVVVSGILLAVLLFRRMARRRTA